MSGIAYAIIMGIISLIGGVAAGGISNAMAEAKEDRARQKNFDLSEQAAENADIRGRNLYTDLQSPNAQMQQLKAAGLSPSLFYSGNGNLQGASTGAMGNFAGVNPHTFGIDALNGEQLANMDLIRAQAENQRAQARKANEEADTEGGKNARGMAQLAQIYADAGLKNSASALNNANTSLTNLEIYVKENTKDLDIKYMEHVIEKVQWDIKQSEYDAKGKEQQVKITEEVKDEIVKSYRLQNSKILADTWLALANKELAEEEAREIYNNINLAWEQYDLSVRAVENSEEQTKVKREQIEESRRQFDAKLEAIMKQIGIEQGKLGVAQYEAAKKFGRKVTKEVGTRGTFIPYTNITTIDEYNVDPNAFK